jgi:hypothetical protein
MHTHGGQDQNALLLFERGREIISGLRNTPPDNAMLLSDLAWFESKINRLSGKDEMP